MGQFLRLVKAALHQPLSMQGYRHDEIDLGRVAADFGGSGGQVRKQAIPEVGHRVERVDVNAVGHLGCHLGHQGPDRGDVDLHRVVVAAR